MEEVIDYKTLYEGIRHENERLRLNILKMRNAPTFSVNWRQIKNFAQDNYTVLLIAIFAVYYLGSLLIDAIDMIRGGRHE